jgi:RES domain-containing protein
MFLWRISTHPTLDGRGGLTAPARWHSEGRRIVYLAESPAGALVEALVHLELDLVHVPKYYRLVKVEAANDVSLKAIAASALDKNWTTDPMATRALGDEWLASGSTALLRVPSAILPETFNLLLSPEHADAARVQILWHSEYPWDERLLSS